jgi:hypothetical protein
MNDKKIDPPASEAWRPTRPPAPQARANDYVRHPDLRILETLCRLASWRCRTWCYPSLKTIGELSLMFTKRFFPERTLCKHLGALVRDGWLRRQRRHTTAKDGSLELHSTLYVMTARAWFWAKGLGLNVQNRYTAARNSLPLIALPDQADRTVPRGLFTPNRAARAPPRT